MCHHSNVLYVGVKVLDVSNHESEHNEIHGPTHPRPLHARTVIAFVVFRFMVRHIQDLYTHVQNMSSKNRKQDWLVVMDRVRNQVLLRAVSCCQLASKLTSHYKVMYDDYYEESAMLREFCVDFPIFVW